MPWVMAAHSIHGQQHLDTYHRMDAAYSLFYAMEYILLSGLVMK
jgi:hypothetical protein